jgi:uncharacterized protein YkwD
LRKGLIGLLASLSAVAGSAGCGPAVHPGADHGPAERVAAEPGAPRSPAEPDHPAPLLAEGDGALESEDPGALEEALFRYINASRAEHGLRPLVRARDLDAVARGYSAELAGRPGRLSHDSPISGSPADRVRAARISFVRLMENLAKAPNAAIAHDGLMNSPGHRANILNGDVAEVGVGVVIVDEDGAPGLLATQLFASRPGKVDPQKAADGLVRRINARRKAAGLAPLKRNAWMDARARKAAEGCFDDRPVPVMGIGADAPVSSARTLGFLVGEIEQVDELLEEGVPGIMEEGQDLVGVAVAQGTHAAHGEGIICVRIVVGAR